MNILALDCADRLMSAALAAKDGLFYTEIDSRSRHSELLLECVDFLFKTSGLEPGDLNLVSCMKGPGSFTGLRIGFSTAKGLALALGIPLVAIPTLDCLSHHLSVWPGIVIPAMDAKKGCFFTAIYRKGKKLTEYMDISPEIIVKEALSLRLSGEEPIVLSGGGAELLLSGLKTFDLKHIEIDPSFGKGRARELLEITKGVILNDVDEIDSGPLYIRKSDAELNKGI